jgi:hypothetical protein
MPRTNIEIIPSGFFVWIRGTLVEGVPNVALYDRELNSTGFFLSGTPGTFLEKLVMKDSDNKRLVFVLKYDNCCAPVKKVVMCLDSKHNLKDVYAYEITLGQVIVDISANNADSFILLCGKKSVTAAHLVEDDAYTKWTVHLSAQGTEDASMICSNGTGKCFAVAYKNGSISIHHKSNGSHIRSIFPLSATGVNMMIEHSNMFIVSYRHWRHLVVIDPNEYSYNDKIVSCDIMTNEQSDLQSIKPSVVNEIVLSYGDMGIFKFDTCEETITRFPDAERSRGSICDAMYDHAMKSIVYVKNNTGVNIFRKALISQ